MQLPLVLTLTVVVQVRLVVHLPMVQQAQRLSVLAALVMAELVVVLRQEPQEQQEQAGAVQVQQMAGQQAVLAQLGRNIPLR